MTSSCYRVTSISAAAGRLQETLNAQHGLVWLNTPDPGGQHLYDQNMSALN